MSPPTRPLPARPRSVTLVRAVVTVLTTVLAAGCAASAAPAAPGREQVHRATLDSGATVRGIDVRDDAGAAGDVVRDRGPTRPAIFDSAGRSLVVSRGYPRNTVPSTSVLDRSHRVAAIFLTSVRVGELMPVVQQVAAEPMDVGGGS